MARNRSQIFFTWGQKYELDQSSWSTYAKFVDTYKHNYLEMVDAGVAELVASPEWQDKEAKVIDESSAFGCKTTHSLKYPDYCVVMDEVVGNINMKGDGHIGGDMYHNKAGVIVQQKVSRNDKNFTLCGLTLLNGKPIVCIVILAGIRENNLIELGIKLK